MVVYMSYICFYGFRMSKRKPDAGRCRAGRSEEKPKFQYTEESSKYCENWQCLNAGSCKGIRCSFLHPSIQAKG